VFAERHWVVSVEKNWIWTLDSFIEHCSWIRCAMSDNCHCLDHFHTWGIRSFGLQVLIRSLRVESLILRTFYSCTKKDAAFFLSLKIHVVICYHWLIVSQVSLVKSLLVLLNVRDIAKGSCIWNVEVEHPWITCWAKELTPMALTHSLKTTAVTFISVGNSLLNRKLCTLISGLQFEFETFSDVWHEAGLDIKQQCSLFEFLYWRISFAGSV
jgi:hypothetical protein